MKRVICLLLACVSMHADQQVWNGANQIPGSTNTTGPIVLCDAPAQGSVVAAWIDQVTTLPMYSVYELGVWSPTPAVISNVGVNVAQIALAYDGISHDVFAVWYDGLGHAVYGAVFHGGTWTTTVIGATTSGPVNIGYSSTGSTGQIIAAWPENGTNIPTYSLYDNSSPGWTVPQSIDAASTSNLITLLYDNSSTSMIAAWKDGATQFPTYSLFSGTTWSLTSLPISSTTSSTNISLAQGNGSSSTIAAWADSASSNPTYSSFSNPIWSAASPITVASQVNTPINLISDSASNQTFAVWFDSNLNVPYYSIYSGGWGVAAQIPGSTTVQVPPPNLISLAIDQFTNELFASWTDSSGEPFYSIYSAGNWNPNPLPIATSPAVLSSVALVYDITSQQTFALWTASGTNLPFYDIYGIPQPASLQPVSSLSGKQKNNRFGLVSEYYNILKWGPSPSPSVVAYQIYRNETLIATVRQSVLKYEDPDQKKQATKYSVIAIDSSGVQSAPTSIIIGGQ